MCIRRMTPQVECDSHITLETKTRSQNWLVVNRSQRLELRTGHGRIDSRVRVQNMLVINLFKG